MVLIPPLSVSCKRIYLKYNFFRIIIAKNTKGVSKQKLPPLIEQNDKPGYVVEQSSI